MKTVAYLRVSTDKQMEHGHGLDAQQSAVVAWALQQQVEVEDYFTDVASGATTDRSELQRLLEEASRGGISKVVVYSVDRLGRNLVDTENTIKTLEAAGTTVVSVTQYFENNPAGKLLRQMLLAFAEFERALIKARLAGGRKAAKAKGKWMGIAPYGFESAGRGELKRIEAEMAHVARILGLDDEGYSLREICRALERENILTPSGSTFHPATISKIVKRKQLYLKHSAEPPPS